MYATDTLGMVKFISSYKFRIMSKVCSNKFIVWLSEGAQGSTVCLRDDKSVSEKCNGLCGTSTCASFSTATGPFGSWSTP